MENCISFVNLVIVVMHVFSVWSDGLDAFAVSCDVLELVEGRNSHDAQRPCYLAIQH